ncbi:MAG TPA: Calx-beta domain-containing protein, partial [Pyrinomonadaceae bacterium]
MLLRHLTNDCTQQSPHLRQLTTRTHIFVALFACALFCAALACWPAKRARAAASDLDPTFDTDGKQTTDFFGGLDLARGIAIQSDGKYVVAGSALQPNSDTVFALARYNTDGSLDTSFGSGGKVTTAFTTGNSVAHAVAIQADGKIIAVGGGTSGDFEIARYNSDGNLDNSFDGDGKLTIDFFGGVDLAQALVIQPDEKIVVVGVAQQNFALVRLNPQGSFDASFGTGGKLITAFADQSSAHAVALQSDGKIIVGGDAGFDSALARYNGDGSLDDSFFLGGTEIFIMRPSQDLFDSITSILIQPDGKIVAGGLVQSQILPQQTFSLGVARLNNDGSLDNSFDGDGRALLPDVVAFLNQKVTVAQQADGKILAAGTTFDNNFKLAGLNLDGSRDQAFGATTDFAAGVDMMGDMALQDDGRVVIVGLANGKDFGLARYQSNVAAPVCLYGVAPSRQVVPVSGGTGTLTIYAPSSCSWNAVSNNSWLNISPPASGTGNAQISYTVTGHTGVGLRTGTITVAGQTFTVVQGGPKVAILAAPTSDAAIENVRSTITATGTIGQADTFILRRATILLLAGLRRYDAVLFFGDAGGTSLPVNPALIGDTLANYVDAGGGVAICANSWATLPSFGLQGRIRTDVYSPYIMSDTLRSGNGGSLIKLQPRHPILTSVTNPVVISDYNMQLTAGADHVADWSNSSPAVATKQPSAGRVVGLNFYPASNGPAWPNVNIDRLMANSLIWAANTNRAISGRITNAAGQGIGGVTLSLNGELTTQTDAAGNYVFFPSKGRDYTVTPSAQNIAFTPASRTFANLTSDQSADFTTQAAVQFSTSALTFNESVPRATLTLTRTNDLSAVTTVNYRTVDDPASVPCADTTTRPGVAFARCDYSTSLDTVSFAPGETQKTLNVPLIHDAHVEPQETFQVVLSSPGAGAALGANSTLTVTIEDDDAPGQPNPVFTTPFFVRQLYLDFLSREPE